MFRIEGVKLGKSAKEFWRLVKDSYVWGFDGPCIIICRSVIEDVLRSKIDYVNFRTFHEGLCGP
jgi:hypothetical protein